MSNFHNYLNSNNNQIFNDYIKRKNNKPLNINQFNNFDIINNNNANW